MLLFGGKKPKPFLAQRPSASLSEVKVCLLSWGCDGLCLSFLFLWTLQGAEPGAGGAGHGWERSWERAPAQCPHTLSGSQGRCPGPLRQQRPIPALAPCMDEGLGGVRLPFSVTRRCGARCTEAGPLRFLQ